MDSNRTLNAPATAPLMVLCAPHGDSAQMTDTVMGCHVWQIATEVLFPGRRHALAMHVTLAHDIQCTQASI